MTTHQVRLLLGSEHACSYLPGRAARSVFIDPRWSLDPARYGSLLDLGFRRSGMYVYRPACSVCQECRPVRIPVGDFVATRTQKRCERVNADLAVDYGAELTEEHYTLYRDYLKARHPGGGMDPEDRAAFHSFLECGWGSTEVWSFRREARLVAAAIVDRIPRGLSAVYTFFDPAERARSLGTLSVMHQVRRAHELQLQHLYLGYWVPHSAKMDYKCHFHPLEELTNRGWRRIERPRTTGRSRDAG